MSSMGSFEVVETFPFDQLLPEVHVVAIREQLVEFVLVGPVGPLDFAIELRRPRFDVDLFHARSATCQWKSAWDS